MYLKLKYKYKKIFWLLLGFCLACLFTTKHVKAFTMPNGYEVTDELLEQLFQTHYANKSYNDIKGTSYNGTIYTNKYGNAIQPFKYVLVRVINNTNFWAFYFNDLNDVFITDYNQWLYRLNIYPNSNDVISSNDPVNLNYYEYPFLTYDVSNQSYYLNTFGTSNGYTENYFRKNDNSYNYVINIGPNNNGQVSYPYAINFPLFYDGNLIKNSNSNAFGMSSIPSYLTGYKRVSLTTNDKYYILSGLSSGSVFIDTASFYGYGGRLSYFDNDITSQPYTSYIQDYYLMPDGEYIRQDFNLNSYSGADFALFSKYIYHEGEDDISYDIWVPNDIHASPVTVTPNLNGGNTFTFDYLDSNGNLQSDSIIGQDLSLNQESPLLSNLFSDFTTNDFGLSSIVTAPLSLIQSLNNATCTDLEVPLGPLFGSGVHDNKLILPCMTPIYQSYFGNFLTYYQTITTGFIAYWVGIAFFNMIKQLKDPENDKIEVINL